MTELGDSEGSAFQMEMQDLRKLAELLDLFSTRNLVFVSIGMGYLLLKISKDEDNRYTAFARQKREGAYSSHPTATAIAYGLQAMDFAKNGATEEPSE